jgi:hypothetical protein
MISKSHFRIQSMPRFGFLLSAFIGFETLPAQAQDTANPGLNPQVNRDRPALRSAENEPSGASPAQTPRIDRAEIERFTNAAEKVLDRIQSGESDLHLRLTYFEKPDRLNPNSYASKGEVTQWQGILQQLKDQHDRVEQMYRNLGKDLDTALQSIGANTATTEGFRKYIMDGFPWPTIEKKKELIADYIDEHGKLLLFYQKNWGSWSAGKNPGNPEFTSASAASIYKKLREQILNTAEEIENQYKAMSQ